MAKRKQKSQEELIQERLERDIQEMGRALELGLVPLNPPRTFEVGERVELGAHNEVYIREVHSDGLFYVCEGIKIKRDRARPAANELFVQPWHEIYKYGQSHEFSFTKEEKYYIRQLNSPIDSLLHMVYASHAGVDFDVDYQRDHVWEHEDQYALIDSIFNNVDIGKFVFIQLHESTIGRYYQVLDGKQRLTALCEFYEDRFPYKGVFYSQLSHRDKHTFRNHGVTYGFLENPNQQAIYETFIKLNTCGRPMDHKHIDKVKKLLNELDDGR